MAEGRADAFKQAGERALARFTVFGFGQTQKWEDAADSFQKAANAYKALRSWSEAADMFERVADLQLKLGSTHEACSAYIEASKSYRNVNPAEAAQALRKAVALYCENGKFSMAARYQKDLAEMFEQDGKLDEALENYRQAGEMFETEGGHKQQANTCSLKVATICSQKGDYATAAPIFEALGRDCLGNRLLTFNAKGYFMQCVLCHLAQGDAVAARSKLDSFKAADYSLAGKREAEFMEGLVTSLDEFNIEQFATICEDYNRISPLDQWKTSVLLAVRHHIEQSVGAAEEEEPSFI